MDCFNILGIKEGASKEEIRQAYEKQVNKFNNEVRDKKKLDKFLSLFKAAYDELMKEFEEKELEEKIIKNIEEEYTHNKGLNENEEIKEVNNTQDILIDTTMMATDEVYTMLEPILEMIPQTMSLERSVSKMVDMYVAMVQRGLKTIEQVPARYREEVREILAKLEK